MLTSTGTLSGVSSFRRWRASSGRSKSLFCSGPCSKASARISSKRSTHAPLVLGAKAGTCICLSLFAHCLRKPFLRASIFSATPLRTALGFASTKAMMFSTCRISQPSPSRITSSGNSSVYSPKFTLSLGSFS